MTDTTDTTHDEMPDQDLEDPQDGAELSRDMARPEVEQRALEVRSVYEGLVAMARTREKMHRTNGRRADAMRFDLTAHSVTVGGTFIVNAGVLRMPVLETASARVDLSGLPWLTEEERGIDPRRLFTDHYLSRPDGSERYMACNFPAKDVDDLTDGEMLAAMPRAEARVRLEAWMLCAALDGTLERYVRAQGDLDESGWWWAAPDDGLGARLVVKTRWWRRTAADTPRLMDDGQLRRLMGGGHHTAVRARAVRPGHAGGHAHDAPGRVARGGGLQAADALEVLRPRSGHMRGQQAGGVRGDGADAQPLTGFHPKA